MTSRFSFSSALKTAGLAKDFNPEQPRDDQGRFASTGSSGASGSAEGSGKTYRDVSHDLDWLSHATTATAAQWDSLSPEEKTAVNEYTGSRYFRKTNKALGEAGGDPSKIAEPAIRQRIATTEAALNKASLPEDLVLYKAIGLSRFGLETLGTKFSPDKVADLKGKVLTDHSFGSSTVDRTVATMFAGMRESRSILRVSAPKGSKALWVGAEGRGRIPHEKEVMIQRGARYLVTGASRQQIGGEPVSVIEVTLLPHES